MLTKRSKQTHMHMGLSWANKYNVE